ncbi:MAG: hypothetical protein WC807_09810, partial [Hyphomicrobium sp.]
HGTAEAVTSAATSAVGNVNDAPTGGVSISGTATQGQTLTAGNTLADADGLGTVSYQWSRDGVAISGATAGTYTLAEADVGHAITVTASYTDGQGTAEAVTSAATSAVGNVNDAPTGGVSIAGTATQGQTLTAGNTLADADGLGTVSYQWSRDGVVISGATAGTYTLAEADVGHAITVTASYTDGQGTFERPVSAATAAVIGSAEIEHDIDGRDAPTSATEPGSDVDGSAAGSESEFFVSKTVEAISAGLSAPRDVSFIVAEMVNGASSIDGDGSVEAGARALANALSVMQRSTEVTEPLTTDVAFTVRAAIEPVVGRGQQLLLELDKLADQRQSALADKLRLLPEPGAFTLETPGRIVVDYGVTLADGRAIPDWLQRNRKGVLSGIVPTGVSSVDLSVTVGYSDGTRDAFKIAVDPNTGEIKPLSEKRADIEIAPLFSAQLAVGR